MSDLPVELITELFIRLPVKSLLRFRSVSKQWRALIDSQDFVKAHLNWSLTAAHNTQRLILGSLGMLHYSDLDFGEDGVKMLDTPFTSFTWLWGSCNGLVLLQNYDNICILNPSTKRFVNLPYCPVEYPDHENENFGLGYDLKNDDYKVVKSMEFRDEVGEWVRSETWVYCFNLGSWRRILDFPYCLPENLPLWGAFVGGVLHANLLENHEFILGLDLSTEDYNFVPLPESFDNKNMGSMHVMNLGDCLCLLGGYIQHPHRTDVWVMNKYGVKESWTKLFSIAPPIVEPYLSVVPLVYSGDGTEVLMIYGNERLIWYNMNRKTVRDARVRNLPWNFYADVFVDSLVFLPGFDVMNTEQRQV